MGATDLSTKFTGTHYGDFESVYSYSNLGPCVDIFAPGGVSLHNPGSTPLGIPLPVCSECGCAVSGQSHVQGCTCAACTWLASSSWLGPLNAQSALLQICTRQPLSSSGP